MKNNSGMTAAQHRKEIIKLINQNSYQHQTFDVFRDFVEMSALAISNSVDVFNRQQREDRYMSIVKRYSKEEVGRFPKMLGHLTKALEQEPSDVMGQVFHELDLGNAARGQFFTPYDVCLMMAQMQVGDGRHVKQLIEQRGFVTVGEPACGAGAMVVAMAQAMRKLGINYQQHLHATTIDVDSRAVHMAYVQFSLLGIPAVVVLGNALSLEEREHWRTPTHVTGMWDTKLHRGYALGSEMDKDSGLAQAIGPPVIAQRPARREEVQLALI